MPDRASHRRAGQYARPIEEVERVVEIITSQSQYIALRVSPDSRRTPLDIEFEEVEGEWSVAGPPCVGGHGDSLQEALQMAYEVESGDPLLSRCEVDAVVVAWASSNARWRFARGRAVHPLVEFATSQRGNHLTLICPALTPRGMLAVLAALGAPEVADWLRGQEPAPWFDVAGDQLPVVSDGDVVAAHLTEEVES